MSILDGRIRADKGCLLYVTPEKLAKSKRLMNKLEKCSESGEKRCKKAK